jgi:hypothetical protein
MKKIRLSFLGIMLPCIASAQTYGVQVPVTGFNDQVAQRAVSIGAKFVRIFINLASERVGYNTWFRDQNAATARRNNLKILWCAAYQYGDADTYGQTAAEYVLGNATDPRSVADVTYAIEGLNEQDGAGLAPAAMVAYQKALYQHLGHKVSVMGGAVSNTIPGKGALWLDQCLDQGLANYADMVSVHQYAPQSNVSLEWYTLRSDMVKRGIAPSRVFVSEMDYWWPRFPGYTQAQLLAAQRQWLQYAFAYQTAYGFGGGSVWEIQDRPTPTLPNQRMGYFDEFWNAKALPKLGASF